VQLHIAGARTTIEDQVDAADCTMYEAKRTGGNQARGARRDSLERCA
jgi:PleD family two-component response regulator